MTYGFIGTGNMASALATAACRAVDPREIYLSNRTADKARKLAEKLGANLSDNAAIAGDCDYIFLGVKPQMMADLLTTLRPVLKRRKTPFVLVSMAAGLTIDALAEMAGVPCPIIRIMPNTPCAVGEGLTLYACSAEVSQVQEQTLLHLLSRSGALEPLSESLIDAGSAVAGCGGAFACLFLEALADGAVACGLPRDKAQLRRADAQRYRRTGPAIAAAHRCVEGCRLFARRHHHCRCPRLGGGRLPRRRHERSDCRL